MTHTNGSFAGEIFGYDANGNRNTTGSTTSTGNETSSDGTYNYAYNKEGNLISKTSIATGNQTLYSWDYRNRLVEVDSKVGSTTTPLAVYTYDAFNNPIKVVEGGATRYTLYDGQTPLLDFNGSGTVTARYLDGPAVDQVLARDTIGGVVAWYITDRLGHATTHAYNADNRLVSETAPSGGGTTTYGYDNANRVTDPLGHVTSSAYDPVDNQTQKAERDGRVTSKRRGESSEFSGRGRGNSR